MLKENFMYVYSFNRALRNTQRTHGTKAQKFLQVVKESQMVIASTPASLAVYFAFLQYQAWDLFSPGGNKVTFPY